MLFLDKSLRKTNFKDFENCVQVINAFWWKGDNSGTFDSRLYILPKESNLSFIII